MSNKYYTPEENMPPIGQPVWIDIKFKYGGEMHVYGKFTESGWDILPDFKEYTVVRWRYFCNHKQ